MNAETFAEWLKRQGYLVVRTESSYWFNQSVRVFQAFPYHWLVRPEESELKLLFGAHKALGLRYSTPLNSPEGYVSYHNIYNRPTYDFVDLKSNARNHVRQGLQHCEVTPIDFETLAEEGWNLLSDTLARQGRNAAVTKQSWQRRCRAAQGLPGFEAWGAFVNGKLGASLLSVQIDDWYHILYQQSSRDFLNYRVNNVLTFKVTQNALERPGVRSIHYGLHSLDAPASVDSFKFYMGYMSYPVRQRIVYNPLIKPFANRHTLAVAERMPQAIQNMGLFSKAKGMLYYYLAGQQSLDAQPWPECLAVNKQSILQHNSDLLKPGNKVSD